MTKRKMPAVLLAGLMILALAGCNANKATPDSGTAADSRITETVTDFTPETTVDTALPADTENKTEATAEKEKAESSAPAESGIAAETRKPAESADKAETVPPTQAPKQSEPPEATELQTDRAAEGHRAAGNQTDRASCNGAAEGLHRSRPYTHRVRGKSLCGKLYRQGFHLRMGRGIGVRLGCRLDGYTEDQP